MGKVCDEWMAGGTWKTSLKIATATSKMMQESTILENIMGSDFDPFADSISYYGLLLLLGATHLCRSLLATLALGNMEQPDQHVIKQDTTLF